MIYMLNPNNWNESSSPVTEAHKSHVTLKHEQKPPNDLRPLNWDALNEKDNLEFSKAESLYWEARGNVSKFIHLYVSWKLQDEHPPRRLRSDEKYCPICGTIFRRSRKQSNRSWGQTKYCCDSCRDIAQYVQVRYRDEALYRFIEAYEGTRIYFGLDGGSYEFMHFYQSYNDVVGKDAFGNVVFVLAYHKRTTPMFMVVNHRLVRTGLGSKAIGDIYNHSDYIAYPQLIPKFGLVRFAENKSGTVDYFKYQSDNHKVDWIDIVHWQAEYIRTGRVDRTLNYRRLLDDDLYETVGRQRGKPTRVISQESKNWFDEIEGGFDYREADSTSIDDYFMDDSYLDEMGWNDSITSELVRDINPKGSFGYYDGFDYGSTPCGTY